MSLAQRLQMITASEYWSAAGWTMIHFFWLGTLLALFLTLLRPLLRRLQPDLRYIVYLGFFACLAILPAILFPYILNESPASISPTAAPVPPSSTTNTGMAELIAIQPTEAPPSSAAAPSLYDALQSKLSLAASYLPWVYLTGAPLALLILATGVAGANRLRQRSLPLDNPDLLDLFDRLLRELAIARPVTLTLCDRIVAPILVGILRPTVLLPPSALAQLTLEQLEMILLHELAHVRRWDNLVNLLQRLAEGLLFFHPAVWVMSRWVRLERERCCDAAVLRRTNQPVQYVETLASLAIPGVAPRYAAAAMANHQLVARIRTILNLEDRTMLLSRRTLACTAGAFVAAMGLVVAYGQQPPPSTVAGDAIHFTADSDADPNAIQFEGNVQVLLGEKSDEVLLERLSDLRRAYLDVKGAVPPELGSLEEALRQHRDPQGLSAALVKQYLNLSRDAGPKRAWGPEQATGAPDVASAGDNHNAWASLTEDGDAEALELTYQQPVEAAAILIHETYNPGAVSRVSVVGADKKPVTVFSGKDPTLGRDKGVFVVSLPKPMSVSRVTISLDSQRVPGWNEIDAVGLLDVKSGEIRWADSATASSTYAERQPVFPTAVSKKPAGALHDYTTNKRSPEDGIQRLTAENQELRKLIQEQRNAMERQEKMLRDLQKAIESLAPRPGIEFTPRPGATSPGPGSGAYRSLLFPGRGSNRATTPAPGEGSDPAAPMPTRPSNDDVLDSNPLTPDEAAPSQPRELQ